MADLPEAGEVVPVRDFAIEHGRLEGGESEEVKGQLVGLRGSLKPNPQQETHHARVSLAVSPGSLARAPTWPGRCQRTRNSSSTFRMSLRLFPNS